MDIGNKVDWFMENVFGFAIAGAICGIVISGMMEISRQPSKDKLYVECLYNMRDRTIDQLEMMCAHLRSKP